MSDANNKIAIIGFSGSVPGADTLDQLHQMTRSGSQGYCQSEKDFIERFINLEIRQNKNFIPIGGGPSRYRSFDASFFGYSPKEARLMDPQIRKSLECAWHTFEQAGYCPDSILSPVGVYMSSGTNAYFTDNLRDTFYNQAAESEKNQIIFLNDSDFLSSRIAYHLNLTGPVIQVKTGCSGSLVALHQACQSLNEFDCDMALAGGVAIKPRYQYGYIYEEGGIMSADGICRPFSADANGTVFTNGLGMVLLKRFEDAIEANDTIYGVIRASFVNNDGNDKAGYMAPSVSGQAKSLAMVMAYGEVEPSDIQYVEAHGTATHIGDPIEYSSLAKIFKKCTPNSVFITSVKGNTGHLDAASGVIGLIKSMLDMRNEVISPLANFSEINDNISASESPLLCNCTLREWTPGPKGRIALVSSYGIGGTNAQVILEQSKDENRADALADYNNPYLFIFSAKNKTSLMAYITDFLSYLHTSKCRLGDIALTLMVGRKQCQYRIAFVARSYDELSSKLKEAVERDIEDVDKRMSDIDLDNVFNDPDYFREKWLDGHDILRSASGHQTYKRIALPCYVFSDTEHWMAVESSGHHSKGKIENVSEWFYMPDWDLAKLPDFNSDLNNKKVIVFSDKSPLSQKLIIQLNKYGCTVDEITINDIDITSSCSWDNFWEKQSSKPDHIIHIWLLDQVSEEQCLDAGLYALMFCYQSYMGRYGDVDFTTTILASNLYNVSGAEITHPAKATIRGISQVLPKECEYAKCHLIDINHTDKHVSSHVGMIINEMHNNLSSECVIRNCKRFIRSYKKINMSIENLGKLKITTKDTYLIIGGLGNFGLELAEFFSCHHGAKVILTTRMNFPDRDDWQTWVENNGNDNAISQKICTLIELESNGANVSVMKADVNDIQSLKNLKKNITKSNKLSGVIHAAGIVESGMINHKTKNSLEAVLMPKVTGTRNVCDVFLSHDLNYMVLCSSMNAIIGGLGQIDNTAANAFVDSYAEYCMEQGYSNVFAINWGAVNEARARNYAESPLFDKLSDEHIKNRMTKSEIFDVYTRLFSTKLSPRIVVSTIDFQDVIENWSQVGSLSALSKEIQIEKQARKNFTDTMFRKPSNQYQQFIAELWERLLGLDVIGLDDDFFVMGGNSLIAIQCISAIKEKFGVKMHAMSIYEYSTLIQFSDYIQKLDLENKQKMKLMEPQDGA